MKDSKRADVAVLILRVFVGCIALYYGSQKLLGVFGGPGVPGTITFMEGQMGIPPVFALLAICSEFFGGLGMIFGFLTSVAAFGFSCVMVMATYENWKTPGLLQSVFSAPTAPDQPAKVFYTVALLGGAVAIMIMGGGAYSIDSKLFVKSKKSYK